jgi:hypothetical protein
MKTTLSTYKKKPITKAYNLLELEAMHRHKIDQQKNMHLFIKRRDKYNRRKGPREGDWVIEKNGKISRITYIWTDEKGIPFQIQTGGSKYGSFYLGNGYISYSGSLDHGHKPNKLRMLKRKMEGQVWFFKDNMWGAHRSVDFMMEFRVFKVI